MKLLYQGANTTKPPEVAAPLNFGLEMVAVMSTQPNVFVVASYVPTHSESCGAKTTRPFEAVVAPLNFQAIAPVVAPASKLTQLNVLVDASNVPTQSALDGANTTKPFDAVDAPSNLVPVELPDIGIVPMLTQLKEAAAGSYTPTQPAPFGAKTTAPLELVAAPRNW